MKKIGLAREVESPENPGAKEKRVALIPSDVGRLVAAGHEVSVERGAGQGVGFSDEEYEKAGARLQSHREIYSGKDLVVKFKGPSMESIDWMDRGCVLFCMAHFHSFPERAKKLEEKQINVIAMEFVVESPKILKDEIILSKVAMRRLLESIGGQLGKIDVGFLGYSDRLIGAIRRAGNRHTNSLTVYSDQIMPSELKIFGKAAIYVYDSKNFEDSHDVIPFLKSKDCTILDLKEFEDREGGEAIRWYRETHPPYETGMRRIQCLHETGQAGARYGFELLFEKSGKKNRAEDVFCVVYGYGNVGMGAIHEAYAQGVRAVHILGARNTHPDRVEKWLERADLIVNGAEQPVELRGKNFLLTKHHAKVVLADGTVVIDLVGGSSSNRSPVENVVECTFLTNPYFIEDGIYFSALWGWPMMGMMRETAIRYSGQIVDVLMGTEKLLEAVGRDLGQLHSGVKPALVCGPYSPAN